MTLVSACLGALACLRIVVAIYASAEVVLVRVDSIVVLLVSGHKLIQGLKLTYH
jgi:hypothetical protein